MKAVAEFQWTFWIVWLVFVVNTKVHHAVVGGGGGGGGVSTSRFCGCLACPLMRLPVVVVETNKL